MRTLEITTNIGCIIQCKYCPQDKLIKAYGDEELMMSVDTFKKCLDKVPADVRIEFVGMSEPWLNKFCTDMLEYAVSLGRRIVIYSTFRYTQLKEVEDILRMPIESIVVHVPDSHGNTNIKMTDAYGKVLLKLKLSDRDRMRRGLEKVSFVSHGNPIESLCDFQVLNLKTHSRAGNVDAPIEVDKPGKVRCEFIDHDHNVLLPNGDVVLCCMDYGMKYVIGNLLKQSYEEISSYAKSLVDVSLCHNCVCAKEI